MTTVESLMAHIERLTLENAILKARMKELEAERDTAQAAVAEMRSAIEALLDLSRECDQDPSGAFELGKHALSSDAGKDWKSPERVHWLVACLKWCRTQPMISCSVDAMEIIDAALTNAGIEVAK